MNVVIRVSTASSASNVLKNVFNNEPPAPARPRFKRLVSFTSTKYETEENF